ncbi:hypothetical protein, partial [Bradyrhizobium diazoefficiens]
MSQTPSTAIAVIGIDIGKNSFHVVGHCQSACKFDPSSASNFDPFVRRGLTVALGSLELAGIAETRRAR